MSSDMNERPEGFCEMVCPVDRHPCEGQGTDIDCMLCARVQTLADALREIKRRTDMDGLAKLILDRIREIADAALDHVADAGKMTEPPVEVEK